MKTSYEVVDGKPGSSAFSKKWALDGVTRKKMDAPEVSVTVTRTKDASNGDVQNALGHEIGHAQQFAGGMGAIKKSDIFPTEVEAWQRYHKLMKRAYTLQEAQMILDALNTYRRGYKVDDRVWLKARADVEGWC